MRFNAFPMDIQVGHVTIITNGISRWVAYQFLSMDILVWGVLKQVFPIMTPGNGNGYVSLRIKLNWVLSVFTKRVNSKPTIRSDH